MDTGITLEYLVNGLVKKGVKDIKVTALLLKPAAYQRPYLLIIPDLRFPTILWLAMDLIMKDLDVISRQFIH